MGLKDIIGGASKDGKDTVKAEFPDFIGWGNGGDAEDDMGAPEAEPHSDFVPGTLADAYIVKNHIEIDESPEAPFVINKKFPDYLAWSTHPSADMQTAMDAYKSTCIDLLNTHETRAGYSWSLDDEGRFTLTRDGKTSAKGHGDECIMLPNDIRDICEKNGSPLTNAEAETLLSAQTKLYMATTNEMNTISVIVDPPMALGEDGLHNAGPWGSVDLTEELEMKNASTADIIKINELRNEAQVVTGVETGLAAPEADSATDEADGTRHDFVPAFYDESVGVKPDAPMAVNVKFTDEIPWSKKPTAEQAAEMRSYLNDCCDILNKHDPSVDGTWQVGPSGELVCCDADGNALKNSVKMMPNEIRLYCESVGSPLTNEDALLVKTHLDSFEELAAGELVNKSMSEVTFITKEGTVERDFSFLDDWKKNHAEIEICPADEQAAITANRERNGIECPVANVPGADQIGPQIVPAPGVVTPGHHPTFGMVAPSPSIILSNYDNAGTDKGDAMLENGSYKDSLDASFGDGIKDALVDTDKKHKTVDKEMESLTESIQGAAQKEDDEPLFGFGKFGQ